MNILFRADSSSTIGTGHIMRDLVLASQLSKEYPDANVIFATQNLEDNINYKIIDAGYKIIPLNSNQKEELLPILNSLHAECPEGVELLVIDHYGIGYEFESYLKENSPIKILSFDDTYEKHYCDIILNHNIYADKAKYKELVPKKCELQCGTKYTLLRDEFYQEKKKIKKRKSKKEHSLMTVFLAMGGADTANLNIKILKVLKKFENIKVNLVTTTANKNLNKLKNYCKNKEWIKLHVNSDRVAKHMRKSDFAIITPSVTANEAYFMELPFLAIKTAENQDDMYKYLDNKKYFVLKAFKKNRLHVYIKQILIRRA